MTLWTHPHVTIGCAAASCALLATGCGALSTPSATTSTPPALPAQKVAITSAEGAAAATRLVVYPTPVEVAGPADVAKLTDTTPEFKDFIAKRVGECKNGGKVSVSVYRSDGWARGEEFCPGDGGLAIWGQEGYAWELLLSWQGVPECTALRGKRVPSDVVPDKTCTEGGQRISYSHP